ncbi:MAG: hypothetical protein VX370_03710 [Bacteroidota bacterium]|nr:hypothetical protein [Bacteroidota bacterium]
MKKSINFIIIISISLFLSCSKDKDKVQGCTYVQATNYNYSEEENNGSCLYSLNKVWEYDYWTIDGVNGLSVFPLVGLFIWEAEGVWATEVYDASGYITDISSAGLFTMSEDQTSAVFTADMYYDLTYGWTYTSTTMHNATINKIDGDELDLTFNHPTGETEVIKSFESSTALPPLGFTEDNIQRKQLFEKLIQLKEKRDR